MSKKRISVLALGAILLSISSLLSRGLGVLRDFAFSKVFGVGTEGGVFALDAYFAAFRIPDLLYTLLIFGAMSAAFIPIYSRLLKRGEQANHFANQVLNSLLLLLLLASVIFWFLSPVFVPWIAPGFDAELTDLTVSLTRIMLLSPLFLGLSSVFQGIENSHKTFIGIALAPIVYNLSIIIGAWFYAPTWGVYALAWSVVIGAFLHFLVQIPGALRCGFRPQLFLNIKGEDFKEFILLSIPRLFGIAVSQVGIFIDTIIASLLALGSLSVFNYALNLQSLPHGVVAVSFSLAVFSTLTEHGLEEDKTAFVNLMRRSTNAIFFWVVPAVVGLYLLSEPIVYLILKGGAFDEQAAHLTVLTLKIFVWAALAQSMIPLFARSFYSLHETKRPVFVGFVAVLLNMTISLILTQVYNLGVHALAISALVSTGFNALFLILFLGRFLKLNPMNFFEWKKLSLIVFTSGLMTIVILALNQFIYPHVIIELALKGGLGLLVYLGLSALTKTIPSLRLS